MTFGVNGYIKYKLSLQTVRFDSLEYYFSAGSGVNRMFTGKLLPGAAEKTMVTLSP
ncbi:hypothetical protein D3C74_486540 [compost metagenome]